MNGILFIDFNLVACDFLKFDRCKMLNGYPDFSFNISLGLHWTLVFFNLKAFAALRAKTYTYLTDNKDEDKKAKSTKSVS